jgi:hypothetical protein
MMGVSLSRSLGLSTANASSDHGFYLISLREELVERPNELSHQCFLLTSLQMVNNAATDGRAVIIAQFSH